MYLPEHVGIPLGTDDSPKYVVMQMHYDNPDGTTGMQCSLIGYTQSRGRIVYDLMQADMSQVVVYSSVVFVSRDRWQLGNPFLLHGERAKARRRYLHDRILANALSADSAGAERLEN